MIPFVRRLIPLLLSALLLTGCAPRQGDSASVEFLAMDTYMSIDVYGDGAGQAARDAQARIQALEGLLSVTDEGSEIYAANHSEGAGVSLSEDTVQVLSLALEMAALTGGAFDPTIYPVVTAWGFTTGSYQVPDRDELAAALALVDYAAVDLDRETGELTLPAGMELDLGGIAKGWAGDQAAQLLREAGITCAIARLGGNIQLIGSRSDGTPWRVGIQDPDSDGTLAILSVTDCAVVTSGGYQRYFAQDGETYWHIIDPATGEPARSGVTSVTVVGPSGARCDALSTALFVLGLEEGSRLWREQGDFQAVFVLEDGSVFITQGLEDSFELAQGYEGREVSVLR